MDRRAVLCVAWLGLMAASLSAADLPAPTALDKVLNAENQGRSFQEAGYVDDLAYLRRVTVDIVGRIPTVAEVDAYLALPAAERRAKAVDRLLENPGFNDRWTVFFADMLRIRSNADGGGQWLAYVHNSLSEKLPYDVMCKQLISASGKAGKTPEIGFILGDQADPMALAGVTSQVFMGIRIACAQCHDHPFDVWTRRQFYGFAAYFGKTRRVESELTRSVFTTETTQTAILWPPADPGFEGKREAVMPEFPFAMADASQAAAYMARLAQVRSPKETKNEGPSLDDLLADAGQKAVTRASGKGPEAFDVASESQRDAKALNVRADLYKASADRTELASLVTSPRNRYFSESFVNRVWKELVGLGIVEPIDDFSEENTPSHPQTLAYLADEFVAQGYDLRQLVRMVVLSQPYQRSRLTAVNEVTRQAAEEAFVSAPLRRMLSESLFDSIVQAGHLSAVKYPSGANIKTIRTLVRIPLEPEVKPLASLKTPGDKPAMPAMQGMKAEPVVVGGGYDLESSIELNFAELLKSKDDPIAVDKMQVMSNEELEAMKMTPQNGPRQRYVERFVETKVDDNPQFASAMRMASPADPSHFLRIFGQTARTDLGEHRDDSANMRQALMMLNGKLTHEAARVGDFEPMFHLVAGEKPDLKQAVRLAYREILTREPSAAEVAEGLEILADAQSPRDGMADLRWVLFNCHEFRFLQ